MTANQIAYWNLQEAKRSNLAKEAETHRTNVENEKLKDYANEVNAYNTAINFADTKSKITERQSNAILKLVDMFIPG